MASVLRDEPSLPPIRDTDPTIAGSRILTAARQNGVLTPLFHKIRDTPVWEELPESLRNELILSAKLALAWETATKADVVTVLNALAGQGIRGVLLKGIGLAHLIYPAPYHRARGDADLLVRDRSSADQAWELLRRLGYEREPAVEGEFISHQFSCSKPGPFQRAITFDIHWKLSNSNYLATRISFPEIWEKRIRVAALGPHAFAIGLPHAMLHALFHRAWHLGEGEPERLTWLYDIHLLGKHFDADAWQRFSVLAARHRLAPICLDGLHAAREAFGSSIPKGVIASLEAPGAGSRAQLALKRPGIYRLLVDMNALGGWRERLGSVREHLFPPRRYMAAKFGADRTWKLPFAYLRRALGGIRKRI